MEAFKFRQWSTEWILIGTGKPIESCLFHFTISEVLTMLNSPPLCPFFEKPGESHFPWRSVKGPKPSSVVVSTPVLQEGIFISCPLNVPSVQGYCHSGCIKGRACDVHATMETRRSVPFFSFFFPRERRELHLIHLSSIEFPEGQTTSANGRSDTA